MIHIYKEKYNILVKDPCIQSQAAGLLLQYKYLLKVRGGKKIPRDKRVWFTFRNKYMKRQRKKGKLKCFYCGRSPLDSNCNNPYSNKAKATIDHIIPLSKGGKEYDESNLVVACYKCNQKKGDKYEFSKH